MWLAGGGLGRVGGDELDVCFIDDTLAVGAACDNQHGVFTEGVMARIVGGAGFFRGIRVGGKDMEFGRAGGQRAGEGRDAGALGETFRQ